MVIGIDEVGRGCWAGPLVACAVLLDEQVLESKKYTWRLADSKKLSAKKRKLIAGDLMSSGVHYGLGWVEPSEVDKMGLTDAVREAMQRAVSQLDTADHIVIIDGNINYLPQLKNSKAIIKADDSIPAVSAASIIAKVARDEYMIKVGKSYPEYGFENHVGYGTPSHIKALETLGVSDIHRKSYAPIKKMLTWNV
jgi:ribonuclease HII